MAEPPILDVAGLNVVYDGETGAVPVVRDVGFTLGRGEALGLVGESGSGKTTVGLAVIRHLAENGRITGGTIRFDGTDLVPLAGPALRRARGQRIAMVYQDPAGALNPSLRIGRQIAEVYRCRGESDRRSIREQVLENLRQVDIPDAAYACERYPHEFSGGQQQRIVIAMALAMKPDLLILDEPTTGLDVSVEAEILDLFGDLRHRLNAAILFISHNIAVIARMCDRVGVLQQGELVETGPVGEVLGAPAHPYTRDLLAARIPFGARKDVRPRNGGAADAPLLETRDIAKTYHANGRAVRAVAGVSLALAKGRVLGIVGESGSGKTTTARIIAGLAAADSGRIVFEGRDIEGPVGRRDAATLSALQMVFQNPDSTLNPKHRVGRILRRSARKLSGAGRAEAEALVAQMIAAVRLEPRHADAYPGELSGGQRQRVAIARAFIGSPRLVLCDEPTSALDVSVQAAILGLLIDLQLGAGTSYVFISHDLAVVGYIADHIAVMYLGEVVESGPAERVFAAPHHPYTETLLSAVASLERPEAGARIPLRGPPPSLLERPKGCPFHPRCPRKVGPVCEAPPPWQETPDGRRYRCVIAPSDVARRHGPFPPTPTETKRP
ncbi:MAG: dipeptide ABC transporter ATP-binding protein [Parvibaculaceae bacterium]